jgi:hypothetical protein
MSKTKITPANVSAGEESQWHNLNGCRVKFYRPQNSGIWWMKVKTSNATAMKIYFRQLSVKGYKNGNAIPVEKATVERLGKTGIPFNIGRLKTLPDISDVHIERV